MVSCVNVTNEKLCHPWRPVTSVHDIAVAVKMAPLTTGQRCNCTVDIRCQIQVILTQTRRIPHMKKTGSRSDRNLILYCTTVSPLNIDGRSQWNYWPLKGSVSDISDSVMQTLSKNSAVSLTPLTNGIGFNNTTDWLVPGCVNDTADH
jgi:hypothetical protein